MPLVLNLAPFAGLLGFYLLASRIFRPLLSPPVAAFSAAQQPSGDGPDRPGNPVFLLLFFFWCFALAMAGAITGTAYYIGVEIDRYVWAVGGIGLLGLIAGWREISVLRSAVRESGSLLPRTRTETAAAGAVAVVLGFYLVRVFTVWQPHDEVAVYGFLTKVIANGFSASDVIEAWRGTSHSGPKTIESLDAIFYAAADDTYLVRVVRWLNLAFVTSGIVGFLRLCGVSRTWALLGAAAFLLTPDLAVIGLTLKVDGVLMAFELAAMFCIVIGVAGSPDRTPLAETLADKAPVLFCALVLGMAAVTTRQSGLYVGFLAGLAFAGSLIALAARRGITQSALLFAAGAAVVAVGFIPYVFNIAEYGNPIFPFKAGWPFASGEHTLTLDQYRDLYNLRGLPPGLSELYLLFHAAFGVEWIMRDVAWLPHNAHDASIRWLSPAILCVFVVPFFFRVRRLYAVLFVMFLYQYALWSQGIQYTRVFMGSSALMVIAAALIAGERNLSQTFRRVAQRAVQVGIVACVGTFLAFHAVWLHGQEHLAFGFADDGPRDQKRLAVALDTYGKDPDMTRQDRERFQAEFDRFAKPKIFIGSINGRLIHVLFEQGFFMEPSDNQLSMLTAGRKYTGPYQCLLATTTFLDAHKATASVSETFGPLRASSANGGWRLHCRGAS